MGLFERISSALGGSEQVERFASGRANFDDPNSGDLQHWNELAGASSPEDLQDAIGQAARQVDPQEYQEHITPGPRGTDPLGSLGQGALTTLAGSLIGNLLGGGIDRQQLPQMVPGLQTTDPNQMSPQEVASLADWTRRNRPDEFARAAAQANQQEPGLLEKVLGNKALVAAAAGLAAKYLASRR
ncbi:MAG: hypothetical protein ACRDI2_07605 [Chloroflexota bacterium]